MAAPEAVIVARHWTRTQPITRLTSSITRPIVREGGCEVISFFGSEPDGRSVFDYLFSSFTDLSELARRGGWEAELVASDEVRHLALLRLRS